MYLESVCIWRVFEFGECVYLESVCIWRVCVFGECVYLDSLRPSNVFPKHIY